MKNNRFSKLSGLFLVTFLCSLFFISFTVSASEIQKPESLQECISLIQNADQDLEIDWGFDVSESADIVLPEDITVTINGGSFGNLNISGTGTLILNGVTVQGSGISEASVNIREGTLRLIGGSSIYGGNGSSIQPNGQSAITASENAVLLIDDADQIIGGNSYSKNSEAKLGTAIQMDDNTTLIIQQVQTLSSGTSLETESSAAVLIHPSTQIALLDQTASLFTEGRFLISTLPENAVSVQSKTVLYTSKFQTVQFGTAYASFNIGEFDYQCQMIISTSGWSLDLNASTDDSGTDVIFNGWSTDTGIHISDSFSCTVVTPAQDITYTAEFTYACGCHLDLQTETVSETMPYYSDSVTLPLSSLIKSCTRSGECRLHDETIVPDYSYSISSIQIGQSQVLSSDYDNYVYVSNSELILYHVRSDRYTISINITASLPEGPSVTEEAQIDVVLGEPNNTTFSNNMVEYDLSTQKDLALTPNWNGNTLVNVVGYHDTANEKITVSENMGYYLSDDGQTIYLSSDLFSDLKSNDEVRFVFHFSAGDDQQVIIRMTKSYVNFFALPNNNRLKILVILLISTGIMAFICRRKFGKS